MSWTKIEMIPTCKIWWFPVELQWWMKLNSVDLMWLIGKAEVLYCLWLKHLMHFCTDGRLEFVRYLHRKCRLAGSLALTGRIVTASRTSLNAHISTWTVVVNHVKSRIERHLPLLSCNVWQPLFCDGPLLKCHKGASSIALLLVFVLFVRLSGHTGPLPWPRAALKNIFPFNPDNQGSDLSLITQRSFYWTWAQLEGSCRSFSKLSCF